MRERQCVLRELIRSKRVEIRKCLKQIGCLREKEFKEKFGERERESVCVCVFAREFLGER